MKKTKHFIFIIFASVLLVAGFLPARDKELSLKKNEVCIVLDSNAPEPLRLAVDALVRDFDMVSGYKPPIVDSREKAAGRTMLIVLDRSSNPNDSAWKHLPPLDGFESHRVLADPAHNAVYLAGADMRGAIYAVYTFSEKFLDVPPLWYFCSWIPKRKESVAVPPEADLFFQSPQVRYRAWFPNDTDMFSPWRKRSGENDTLWLETMLRLKLNTVEAGSTIAYPGRMSREAELYSRYGLVLTSHHMIALNSGFNGWTKYWETVRKRPAPALLLANEKEIIEFYRYNIETVHASGIENLWQIAFRGNGDKPFWTTFPDAPETSSERAGVINRMLKIQLDLIKEITGDPEPYVRVTFYDELSDMLASGELKPPAGRNMIWTFCSARRDHYPNDDVVRFDNRNDVKLGYYMNLQFTSTGSHLAPAEGPWKMEANYRYVGEKAPLYFSVVNAGNLREHLLTMSANAAMLWSFDAYDTDEFLLDYCRTYYGVEHAPEIAALYKDYFYSYWEPTKSVFPGMERQFLFQDLRYARAVGMLERTFSDPVPDPLKDIATERTPGRTFRISPEDNAADDVVDAIQSGMEKSAAKFKSVADRCEETFLRLPEENRPFFNDNLRGYARFMDHLSRSLLYYVRAYKSKADRDRAIELLVTSLDEMKKAADALLQTQHGIFLRWYDGDADGGKFNMPRMIRTIERTLTSIRGKASNDAKERWTVLFDGSSTDAFRGWNSDEFPPKGWSIDGDCLKCEKSNGRPNGGGGDLVTKKVFDDFELRWEWKLAKKGNSGVKYMVRKREHFAKGQELFGGDDGTTLVGPEYQMLDDANHPDAKNGPMRRTAAFYQIIAPKNAELKPIDEFNESRLLVSGNHVEHWLNGVKVLEYELGSKAVLDLIGKSKYRFIDGFGTKNTGPILFQDHGDEFLLRNIRVRMIEK